MPSICHCRTRRRGSGAQRLATSTLLASVLVGCAAIVPVRAYAQLRAFAQQVTDNIVSIDLSVGRSFPVRTGDPITRVSVANPDVADVAVVGERDVVISAKAAGETDVLIYSATTRQHFRVLVHSPSDRMQIALYVKFAEVRRDLFRDIATSAVYRDKAVRVGTGIFRDDNSFTPDGKVVIPGEGQFLSVLTNFNTDKLLALLQAQEEIGNARILAEPTLLAANKEDASFLAGGELPIPVAQGGGAGDITGVRVTILFHEFGVRLHFQGEIVSDSLIKLAVRPEVSSLDYSNAIVLSGFRIPAFRTRRVESTIDVKRNESFIISGLFDDEQEQVRTGIPLLMRLPILGYLFSSTHFQRNETELVVVVTPVLVDPMHPRPQDVLRFSPDTTLPARDAFRKRLAPAPASRPR